MLTADLDNLPILRRENPQRIFFGGNWNPSAGTPWGEQSTEFTKSPWDKTIRDLRFETAQDDYDLNLCQMTL